MRIDKIFDSLLSMQRSNGYTAEDKDSIAFVEETKNYYVLVTTDPVKWKLLTNFNTPCLATWWNLKPLSEDYIGNCFIKDVGVGGSWWYSDGYSWEPSGPIVLFRAAALVCPANTSLNTLFKALILPDLMAENRELIFDGLFSFSSSANAKTLTLTAGSFAAPTTIGTTAPTTNAALNFSHKWSNTSKNSQSFFPSLSTPYTLTATAMSSSNVDTAYPFYIGANVRLANAGDTAQINKLIVTLR